MSPQHDPGRPRLQTFARELRKNQTDAERLIGRHLRHKAMGYGFLRQYPIGPYIVDFYCHERKLVVELDGGQHAEESAKRYDEERTLYLNNRGIRVIRFWDPDVFKHTDAVLQTIWLELRRDLPPSPGKEVGTAEGRPGG